MLVVTLPFLLLVCICVYITSLSIVSSFWLLFIFEVLYQFMSIGGCDQVASQRSSSYITEYYVWNVKHTYLFSSWYCYVISLWQVNLYA
jgi:hypothetical protein